VPVEAEIPPFLGDRTEVLFDGVIPPATEVW
jgi:hypothetical protein